MNPLGTGDPLRLGPYRLIGVLGAGGMGKVYLGRDNGGRTAAVKVLRPELAHDPHLASASCARRRRRRPYAARASPGCWVRRPRADGRGSPREFLAGPDARPGRRAPRAVRRTGRTRAGRGARPHAARTSTRPGWCTATSSRPNIVLTSAGPRVIDFGIARPEHGLTLTTTGQVAGDARLRPARAGAGAAGRARGGRVRAGRGARVRGERAAGVRRRARGGGAVRSGARRAAVGGAGRRTPRAHRPLPRQGPRGAAHPGPARQRLRPAAAGRTGLETRCAGRGHRPA